MEKIIEYAPIVLVLTLFFINYRIFTTPVDLEKKHREILDNIDKKYATKSVVSELQSQIHTMAEKIDKIYDILIEK